MPENQVLEKNSLQITEEMGLHKKWYEEAKNMTLEELPEFLQRLTKFEHDYGTVCHALAASAIASAWAMNNTPQGGITGFQAGAVMWEFIKHWMSYENEPMRLTRYNDLLYPQHEDRFTSISKDTWKWLQEKAAENLASSEHATDRVRAHWKSIVDGQIPFGLTLDKDDD